MESKSKVTPRKEVVAGNEGPEVQQDGPLLDLSDATLKKLIGSAKRRGYVTHDQINSLSKEVNSERIEDVLATFNEMGVNIVETADTEPEERVHNRRDIRDTRLDHGDHKMPFVDGTSSLPEQATACRRASATALNAASARW